MAGGEILAPVAGVIKAVQWTPKVMAGAKIVMKGAKVVGGTAAVLDSAINIYTGNAKGLGRDVATLPYIFATIFGKFKPVGKIPTSSDLTHLPTESKAVFQACLQWLANLPSKYVNYLTAYILDKKFETLIKNPAFIEFANASLVGLRKYQYMPNVKAAINKLTNLINAAQKGSAMVHVGGGHKTTPAKPPSNPIATWNAVAMYGNNLSLPNNRMFGGNGKYNYPTPADDGSGYVYHKKNTGGNVSNAPHINKIEANRTTALNSINAARSKAQEMGLNVSIVIVDKQGRVIHRWDDPNVQKGSLRIALQKARSAAKTGAPTLVLQEQAKAGQFVQSSQSDRLTPLQGGLKINDNVFIGVSGANSAQDEHIAQTAIDALKSKSTGNTVAANITSPVPPLVYGANINPQTAQQVMNAALAKAKDMGVSGVAVIINTDGKVVLRSQIPSGKNPFVHTARQVARTANDFLRNSGFFAEQVAAGNLQWNHVSNVTPRAGGEPIIHNGKVIGAIGFVSNNAAADAEIAKAAAKAGKSHSSTNLRSHAPQDRQFISFDEPSRDGNNLPTL